MKRYNPKAIEPKWQSKWQKDAIYKATDFDKRPKYVMLTEFPYPSGSGMHIGHIREYTLGDIIARQQRMLGRNVLFPMGYDAFGLPAENYAIKHKISPQKATEENIANFQSQLEQMGYSFDWSRKVKTSDPSFYKWTQWLFLRFFKAGMAYQEETLVNWCPFCKSGLANEEVVNGRHERCDTPVEKKELKQWLLRITDYADRLIDGLTDLDYPTRIAEQQINWIGRSYGAEISFIIEAHDLDIKVFTTRADTIYGATFLVLAPEHPLVSQITTKEHKERVETYVHATINKTDLERQEAEKEKTGVFTGAYAINPLSKAKIPIWIADYILMGYGTGAIMAVPAHDERDYAFAKKYDLEIKRVIEPKFIATSGISAVKVEQDFIKREAICAVVYDPKTDSYLCNSWKGMKMHGLITGGAEEGEDPIQAAKREVEEETGYKNIRFIEDPGVFIHSQFYHRQKEQNRWAHFRFIFFELVNDEKSKVDEKEAKLLEPVWVKKAELEKFFTVVEGKYLVSLINHQADIYSGEGVMANSGSYDWLDSATARDKIVADLSKKGLAQEKINYRLRDWIFSRQRYWGEPIPIIHCPKDGAVAVPDKDLPVELPLLEDYEPTENGESPLARATDWLNVACPECGNPAKRETDTMPNWAGSSWYYLRYYDPNNTQVFADAKLLDYWGAVDLYLGGMEHTTLHLLYSRFWHQFFYDQGLVPTKEPYQARRGQGIVLAADGTKMSKSKGNVVDPSEIINSGYGADALRLAIAFLAPYDQTTAWSPETLGGTFRFLQRIWTLAQQYLQSEGGEEESDELKRIVNKTIKRVSQDLMELGFNTVVAALMECVNELYKIKTKDNFKAVEWQWALENLLKLVAPLAPHLAEELWQELGNESSIHLETWPSFDNKYISETQVVIAVQINGKVRGEISQPVGSSEADTLKAALADSKIAKHVSDKKIARTIYVPDKLLSLVIN